MLKCLLTGYFDSILLKTSDNFADPFLHEDLSLDQNTITVLTTNCTKLAQLSSNPIETFKKKFQPETGSQTSVSSDSRMKRKLSGGSLSSDDQGTNNE